MDCQTAIEYINLYADNMLGKKEIELLFSHISSCAKCKKEFEDILAVKRAFAGLRDIEPPAGLALAAIRKAKKRRIPIFAYASAGVAAVIALVAVFSSSIFGNPGDMGMQKVLYSAESKSMAADTEMPEVCASAAPEEGFTLAPQMEGNGEYAAPAATSEAMDTMIAASREASVSYINVPADISDKLKESLVAFLEDNDIEYNNFANGDNIMISFKITEDKLDDLKALIDEAFQNIDEAFRYQEELSAGDVQFIFN